MEKNDYFTSRWGLVLAGLGMAVGTGNLWRFPRIAAQNEGGTFLIPWLIFLFAWSIPLLLAEFSLGRRTRRGPIQAFARVIGERSAWMGGFVVVTSVMIMFYYSVVTGWTLKYVFVAASGTLAEVDSAVYWATYSGSLWQPALFHVVAISIAGLVVARGIVQGIERVNRLLIPALFILLLVAVARTMTLPGASEGFAFLFIPNLSSLTNYRIWLEALTQSAWSTGAGWGLILSYAVYVRDGEDIGKNALMIGIGNNVASVLAAMAILPAAFALLPTQAAQDAMAAGNVGLTFIWIPQLFNRIPAGQIFLTVFFLALFCAALSSLIAMVELAARALIDAGLSRVSAVRIVVAVAVLLGLPSALSLQVFENQDWVWGLALMISGLLIAIAAIRCGFDSFGTALTAADLKQKWLTDRLCMRVLRYLVPVEFTLMFGWWMYQSVAVYDPEGWWNPVRIYSVGTCLAQWGIALIILMACNRRLGRGAIA